MALQIWRPGWGLVPRRPWRDIEDVDRWLEDWTGRPLSRRTPFRDMEWAPSMEMLDKEDKFVVRAELPGIKEEDVDVCVSDNILTVKGEKKSSSEVKEEDYHFSEMSYGSFSRSITLPSTINTEKITASFEDGVLEINIPKSTEVKPKKISIATKKAAKTTAKKTPKTKKKKE